MTQKINILPSVEYLNECLSYNKETGKFSWKERPLSHFKSKKQQAGHRNGISNKECGTLSTKGYRQISINGIKYSAHRIAWKMIYGFEAENQIDHINGNKSDNRIDNLREATQSQNKMNMPATKANKSGYKGVSLHSNGKYRAEFIVNRKTFYLGLFDTVIAAHDAYCNEAKKYHGEFYYDHSL